MNSNQRLIIAAVVMMIAVVSASDVEERGAGQVARLAKELNQLKKRLNQMISNRMFMLKGRDGRDGVQGRPGIPGKDGSQGARGKRGARGPPGRSGGGVEYIRWGKTSCPAGADFVYNGRIGGEYYNHPGGGSNYICLPMNPKYLNYKPGHQGGAYVYGTEYEVSSFNPFTKNYLHDHDAPCVACHVKTRSSKLMIPATYKCPSGWTREYYGYLMGAYHSNKHSSGFICVDKHAEAVPGTHTNHNGALLYTVEGQCGSLPCYPYVSGREFTCVVCTK